MITYPLDAAHCRTIVLADDPGKSPIDGPFDLLRGTDYSPLDFVVDLTEAPGYPVRQEAEELDDCYSDFDSAVAAAKERAGHQQSNAWVYRGGRDISLVK